MMDHDYGCQLSVTGCYSGGYGRPLAQPPPLVPGNCGHYPSNLVGCSSPRVQSHCFKSEGIRKGDLPGDGGDSEPYRKALETRHKTSRKIMDSLKAQEVPLNGSEKIKTQVEMDSEECETKDVSVTIKGAPKQSQIVATLRWLTQNYERADGVCLPRCVLYTHYLDFCKKQNFSAAGAATFGKISLLWNWNKGKLNLLSFSVHGKRAYQIFRYKGKNRGNDPSLSKCIHVYVKLGPGLGGILLRVVYSGLDRWQTDTHLSVAGRLKALGDRLHNLGSSRKYSLSSKTGTILPDFPEASNLILPENVDRDKVQTFIMMYRTHCQRILDTIISANFEEVQSFLLHFWQGMPEHLVELLKLELIADIIGLCDSILYKVLIDVLIPSTIQDLPDSLSAEIKIFVRRLAGWLESSLEDVPQIITSKKLEVVKTFGQSVKRQMSFVHLAQTTRNVILCNDSVTQMVEDLSQIDFNRVCEQASFTNPAVGGKLRDKVHEYFSDFKHLLKKQASIESFTEWVDDIIDSCVLKKSEQDFSEKAAQFLMQWTVICSLILRDLTLCSASTFGSYHLVHIMLDEYVFLVVETQQNQTKEARLQKAMKKHLRRDEEICTQAKKRTGVPKITTSPKAKKRKYSDDSDNDNDSRSEGKSCSKGEEVSKLNDPHLEYQGVEFGKLQNGYRDPSYPYPGDNGRHPYQSIGPAHHSLSPLKHFSPVHANTFDRASYLTHLSINTYPDFITPTTAIPSPRMPCAADMQNYASGPFTGNGLNVGPTSPSYWNEARPHPGNFQDPYSGYPSYSKYSASYDSYNRGGGLLRSGGYQESLSRSAFDATRPFYGRTSDRHLPGAGFPMSSYSGSYMEVSHHPGPTAGQYPRQEVVFSHPQDDYYSSNMPNSIPLSKNYVSPFR